MIQRAQMMIRHGHCILGAYILQGGRKQKHESVGKKQLKWNTKQLDQAKHSN